MEPLNTDSLLQGALVLVDTAPIIYALGSHHTLAAQFAPLFQRHDAGC